MKQVRAKVLIVEHGSNAWLKEFKEALQCSTFKYKPHINQVEPLAKGRKLTNIKIAQSFQANFDFSKDTKGE